jgi:Luciferase-like monooxygenase
MIEVALMIEGQDGLTWDIWQRIAGIAENDGFVGLYRSDHFTNPNPPDKNSLECWISLSWLAGHTSRIEFGPLVSPISFRDPRMLARQAAAVDDLSGGRLYLGLGAGWQEREHHNFGYELLERGPRFARFNEGVDVVTRLLRSDRAEGRQPGDVRRTMMTGVFLARDAAELERRLGGRSADTLRERGAVVGSPTEIRDQLAAPRSRWPAAGHAAVAANGRLRGHAGARARPVLTARRGRLTPTAASALLPPSAREPTGAATTEGGSAGLGQSSTARA